MKSPCIYEGFFLSLYQQLNKTVMSAKILKKEYYDLESKVILELTKKLEKSKTRSKFIDGKCIAVNIFDYVELVSIDYSLTFLDSNGYNYSLFAECTLEDLIDILNE